jgi:hypothetical protein
MKKKLLYTGTVVFLAAVFFGLYEFFRTPSKANQMKPIYEGSASEFVEFLQENPLESGAVLRINDNIVSTESKSVTFPAGVIATRDTSDTNLWPEEGYISVQGIYNGIEIDDFFGDTIVRLSGCFLLDPAQAK